MKILIDARLYGLENAGLGRYAINLVEYLQKVDKKNDYFVLLRRKYFDELKLGSNWTKILADFRHYSFAEQLRLPEIINKINPGLTHFLHFNVPIFWKGKFVVTIHDMLMHRYAGLSATNLPGPFYWIKRLAYKIAFWYAVKQSVKVLAPSLAVKSEIVSKYNISQEKVIVTYEGVDEEIEISGSEKKVRKLYGLDAPYFVYTGNAYPHKNLERLVEATLLLNKNLDRKVLTAIISSRNVFTQRLKKLVNKIGAADVVKLLGFVSDSDLGSIYKYSQSFIAPSLSEGFGLPGLEAMYSDTLVLASDIPVFREIYKNIALYFNPLDFTSIEKSMRNVLQMDKEARDERIERGRKLAKTFSWLKMARETLKIYEAEGGASI